MHDSVNSDTGGPDPGHFVLQAPRQIPGANPAIFAWRELPGGPKGYPSAASERPPHQDRAPQRQNREHAVGRLKPAKECNGGPEQRRQQ